MDIFTSYMLIKYLSRASLYFTNAFVVPVKIKKNAGHDAIESFCNHDENSR